MIRLLFWACIALDIAGIALVYFLGLAAAGELVFFPAGAERELVEAIGRSDTAAVRALVTRADVNAAGLDGMTPLVAALRQLRRTPAAAPVLRALLQAGADPNLGTAYEKPLEMALQLERQAGREPVTLLLDAGADPNQANGSGFPLYFAGAGRGASLETLALLLDRGADLAATRPRGETVVLQAALARNWPAVQLLLERGADPSLGRTARGDDVAGLVRAALRERDDRGSGGSGARDDGAEFDAALLAVARRLGVR